MKAIIMLLSALLMHTSVLATDSNKVVWPVFYYPPLYHICDGEICGYGSEIIDLISQAMPEYSHDKVLMPLARHFENLKVGKPYLLYGPYRTAERESYLLYSLPCRLTPMNAVVIAQDAAAPHLVGNKISLRSLLGDTTLIRGTTQGASYGNEIDAILHTHAGGSSQWGVYGQNSEHRLFEMFKKHRVDWFIHNPMTLVYFLKQNQLDVANVAVYEIEEIAHPFMVGYIAAPRTPWGEDMMGQINAILQTILFSDAFYQTLVSDVPEALHPSFKQAYEALILTPARAYPLEVADTMPVPP